MKYKNPELEVGQQIKLIKGRNGSNNLHVGKICDVISVASDKRTAQVRIVKHSVQFTIYQTGPGDSWTLSNRKEHAIYLKEKNKELLKEIEENKQEISALIKFKDDEEEVAYKLEQIMKNPKKDAIAKILRTLKTSNMI